MEKSEQTEKVISELYKLTRQFTRALIKHYYWQYRGDPDDLASDFFTEFMTPKASGDRPKETLLDKYDSKITSLPYLVKVSVIRKLIDQSRQHPYFVESLDSSLEEKGDLVLLMANTFEERQSRTEFKEEKLIKRIQEEYDKLPDDQKNAHFVELFDTDSSLTKFLKPALKSIRNCPIQQVTNRTAVIFIPVACTFVSFDVETGKPRGKFVPFHLNEEEKALIKSLVSYHSAFSRDLMQEFYADK